MGVSGSGKTTVGEILAEELAIPFIDADDLHPPSNIDKMSEGTPLDDNDRAPWLKAVNTVAVRHSSTGCVIACSALKEDYRLTLSEDIDSQVVWVYLKGTFDQIFERMKNRKNHFMEAGMLQSQFETLEEPKNAIVVDISKSLEDVKSTIKSHLE